MQYYEDIQIGNRTVTRGRTITEADIVNFAGLSGDWHPLHTDAEYAKSLPFGERISHGLLVLSVASGLMPLNDLAIIAFYGMDKVRFTAPVMIGDTIHVEAEVVEKQEKGDSGGVVSLKQSIKNQRDEEVIISIMRVFLARAPKEA